MKGEVIRGGGRKKRGRMCTKKILARFTRGGMNEWDDRQTTRVIQEKIHPHFQIFIYSYIPK